MNKFLNIKNVFYLTIFILALGSCNKDKDTEPTSTPTKEFTVSFDVNGAKDTIATQTIKENEKATKPTDPIKDNYSFVEWTLDSMAFDFETPITKNIILKAKWEVVTIDGKSSDWETNTSNDGVIITLYKGSDTQVVIPTTIDGKKVVGIGGIEIPGPDMLGVFGQKFFGDNTTVTSISFFNAIYLKNIDIYAFMNCKELISVTFGLGLETIKNPAFLGCTKLETLFIKRTSEPLTKLEDIGVFGGQPRAPLKEVYYPKGTNYDTNDDLGWTGLLSEFYPDNKFIAE